MTWLRLDDQFQHHAKVAPLSDRAWRLHVTAMLECSRLLTDGRIARKVVATWPGAPRGASLRATIDELLDAGLWEPTGTGWDVHDFLDWNPTAEQARARRDARIEAGKRGGKRSAERRAKDEQAAEQVLKQMLDPVLGSCSSKTEAKLNPVPVPVPDQSPLSPPAGGKLETSEPEAKPKRRAPKVPLPPDWRANDQHHAKARELGVNCAAEAQKFRDHALGKDTRWVDWDRAFANWLANAAAYAPRGSSGHPGAGLTPADREQAERDGKLVGEIRAGAWGAKAAGWLQHAEHRGQVNLRQFREWIDHGKVRREVPPPKVRDSPPGEIIELASGIGRRIP